LYKLGYTTGMFGKMLNGMQTYGCGANNPKGSKVPNGWDRFHAFCGACYTNCKWNNQGKRVTDPEYSTSIIGNSSVEWLKSVAGKGRPFFAYLGPHAPHLPATPAPWYANHPVGLNTPPITPHYNYSAPDHHSLIANQPIINSADAAGIEHEYSDRLRSLLSVDDMVAAVVAALTEAGVLSNTYIFYSSDHGYSQGQFRVTSHKTQIYDHVTRVPMLITGPGIKAGTELAPLTAMVDIAPTMIDLAGGTVPPNMDGQSFKAFLLGGTDDQWRDQNVIEYHSIRDTPVMETYSALTGKIEALTAQLYYEQLFTDDAGNGTVTPNFHPHDGPNNTFRALRIINPARNLNLLYSEFTDVTLKKDWDFADGTINFFELYNCTTDPYQMHNLYKQIPASTQALLHDRVKRSFVCVGQTGCTFTPSSWPAIPPFGL
jgi:N-acetylglucosamine-6-sulfatase